MFIECPTCKTGRKRLYLVGYDVQDVEIDDQLSTCDCCVESDDIQCYLIEMQEASMDYEP